MITGARKHIATVTEMIPRRFRITPYRSIERIETFPVLNTIAFGGVATGIMNPQLAETVAGISSQRGSTCSWTASAARIGNTVLIVAVLLVSSVMKFNNVETPATSTHNG